MLHKVYVPWIAVLLTALGMTAIVISTLFLMHGGLVNLIHVVSTRVAVLETKFENLPDETYLQFHREELSQSDWNFKSLFKNYKRMKAQVDEMQRDLEDCCRD